MDMTEINLDDKEAHKELDPMVQLAIKEKLDFRYEFAQKISITRLDYIFRVLRNIYAGKASISDPEAFRDKIRQLERIERSQGIKRTNSGVSVSEFSMYSKSQKTGITMETMTDGGTTVHDDGEGDGGSNYDDKATNFTKNIQNDPIIVGLNNLFDEIQEEIESRGQERINYLNRMYKKA